jgi:SNF2 family DNA or RNA helicase
MFDFRKELLYLLDYSDNLLDFEFYNLINMFSSEEREILFYLKNQRNIVNKSEREVTFLFYTPLDIYLFSMLNRKGFFIKAGERLESLRLKNILYPLKFVIKDKLQKLTVENLDNIFLLPTNSIYFVIDFPKRTIAQLSSVFGVDVISEIFEEGFYLLNEELKTKFLYDENFKKEVKKYVEFSSVNILKEGKFVFDIDMKTQNEFKLSAFVMVDEKKLPLNLEELRKKNIFDEDIVVETENELFVIPENSKLYEEIILLSKQVKLNFFSILNEVKGNTIYSNDTKTLFTAFLNKLKGDKTVFVNGKRIDLADTKDKKVNLEVNHKDIDWYEVKFNFQVGKFELSYEEMLFLLENGYLIKNGEFLSLSAEEIEKFLSFIEKINFLNKEGKNLFSKEYLPYFFELENEVRLSLPPKLKEMKKDIKFFKGTYVFKNLKFEDEVLRKIMQERLLRNYQKIGVLWLITLQKYNYNGILADEMGLGKTLQVLYFLNFIKEKIRPSLIVCPSSLMENWACEIEKFFPSRFNYTIVKGEKEKRLKILKNASFFDILITSYNLLLMDEDEYEKIEFVYCILDEAQHIKNKSAKRTQSLKKIHSKHRVAITGTPLENYPSELWTIFDFLMPDYLGNYQWFKKHIENPLLKSDSKSKKETLKLLHTLISPFILRRTKDIVLKELPPKIEQEIRLELTEKQKLLYLDYVKKAKEKLLTVVQSKGIERSYIEILSTLMRLRQICLHPGIINEELIKEEEISSKTNALLELIYESIDSGHRIVVYSQFVEYLKIIRLKFYEEEIEHLYMDGRTKDRVGLVEFFNSHDIPVLLASIKAGGVGLNITGADCVIIVDPWWNPTVEEQAIDRLHRMGQKNVVFAYRLITRGTIEEKIRNLQLKKKQIFSDVLEFGENFIKRLSIQDIEEIFGLDE